jgi:hypothetical protein
MKFKAGKFYLLKKEERATISTRRGGRIQKNILLAAGTVLRCHDVSNPDPQAEDRAEDFDEVTFEVKHIMPNQYDVSIGDRVSFDVPHFVKLAEFDPNIVYTFDLGMGYVVGPEPVTALDITGRTELVVPPSAELLCNGASGGQGVNSAVSFEVVSVPETENDNNYAKRGNHVYVLAGELVKIRPSRFKK